MLQARCRASAKYSLKVQEGRIAPVDRLAWHTEDARFVVARMSMSAGREMAKAELVVLVDFCRGSLRRHSMGSLAGFRVHL